MRRPSSRAWRELFAEAGFAGGRDRGDAARHDRRLQRHPRAQGRADRADHHPGLPRRAGDPHAAHAAALRPALGQAARRWSSATCAWTSTSGSTCAGESSAPLDEADAERRGRCAARRGGRGDRRLPAAFLRQPARMSDASARSSPRSAPGMPVSLSVEVLPEIKEYERTSHHRHQRLCRPDVAALPARAARGLARRRPGRRRCC